MGALRRFPYAILMLAGVVVLVAVVADWPSAAQSTECAQTTVTTGGNTVAFLRDPQPEEGKFFRGATAPVATAPDCAQVGHLWMDTSASVPVLKVASGSPLGWTAVIGGLPFRIDRDVQTDGSVQYVMRVIDAGRERTIALRAD